MSLSVITWCRNFLSTREALVYITHWLVYLKPLPEESPPMASRSAAHCAFFLSISDVRLGSSEAVVGTGAPKICEPAFGSTLRPPFRAGDATAGASPVPKMSLH